MNLTVLPAASTREYEIWRVTMATPMATMLGMSSAMGIIVIDSKRAFKYLCCNDFDFGGNKMRRRNMHQKHQSAAKFSRPFHGQCVTCNYSCWTNKCLKKGRIIIHYMYLYMFVNAMTATYFDRPLSRCVYNDVLTIAHLLEHRKWANHFIFLFSISEISV